MGGLKQAKTEDKSSIREIIPVSALYQRTVAFQFNSDILKLFSHVFPEELTTLLDAGEGRFCEKG